VSHFYAKNKQIHKIIEDFEGKYGRIEENHIPYGSY